MFDKKEKRKRTPTSHLNIYLLKIASFIFSLQDLYSLRPWKPLMPSMMGFQYIFPF